MLGISPEVSNFKLQIELFRLYFSNSITSSVTNLWFFPDVGSQMFEVSMMWEG